MLQDGTKALKLKGAPGERLAKDTLEHAIRAACSRLIKQAAEQGTNAMLCRHGRAAEPSLERLLDFTVSSSAVAPENYDTGVRPECSDVPGNPPACLGELGQYLSIRDALIEPPINLQQQGRAITTHVGGRLRKGCTEC